eukprot:4130904-Pleurochrysis_carterae.AAC.1
MVEGPSSPANMAGGPARGASARWLWYCPSVDDDIVVYGFATDDLVRHRATFDVRRSPHGVHEYLARLTLVGAGRRCRSTNMSTSRFNINWGIFER